MIPSADEDRIVALQDRFVRGLTWLRRLAGMTQRDLAEAAGWKQPYVARLEDPSSPLLKSLCRLERYAQACHATTVVMFIDPETGGVIGTVPMSDEAEVGAARLLGVDPDTLEADVQAELEAPAKLRLAHTAPFDRA